MPAPILQGIYPSESVSVSLVLSAPCPSLCDWSDLGLLHARRMSAGCSPCIERDCMHMLSFLTDSQEVAQSLPLDPLAQGASESLAADVEYRIHLILQEAKKFMVAGRRSTLLPEDVEYAMDALRVEVSVDVLALPSFPSPHRVVPHTRMRTRLQDSLQRDDMATVPPRPASTVSILTRSPSSSPHGPSPNPPSKQSTSPSHPAPTKRYTMCPTTRSTSRRT